MTDAHSATMHSVTKFQKLLDGGGTTMDGGGRVSLVASQARAVSTVATKASDLSILFES